MQRERFEVAADIARARTLPAEAFTDPAFLALEIERLFPRAWLLVPERSPHEARDDPRSLADLVRRRGARAPTSLLDKPFFLQRDWDGALRMFPNVCTHAWHTLVAGPGREKAITCPQHGRQFDCAGKFVHQPGFEKVEAFPSPDDDLRALPAGEWGGLLFASIGAPAQTLEATLAPVAASLGALDLAALAPRRMDVEARELAGNWKQHAWNYLDALHIPFIHRKPGGLADALDLASYATEIHGDAVLQWAWAKDPAHGLAPDQVAERFRHPTKRVFALWWFVWPNLTLNVYPWGLSINAYMPVPGKPHRTYFLWYHRVLDASKYAERERTWMMTEVDDEDVDALSQTARGAASGFAPRGRFAPETERGPHWFHRRVFESVFTASG
ncbi:MAG TPA: SRPBCC family protein [Candidatus Thermoplasmatota archaeon]|nr:SRPBCC family protein [Candidatus Thermoplasmatota archaeon]